MTADPHLPSLSTRLDLEWATLRHRRPIVDRARSWGVTTQPFADLDELLALAGFRTERSAAANAVVARLVDAGRRDELATRIVLQRVLPGLLGTVRRRRWYGGADEAFELLLGAAWLAIRAYRPERRPERIAANLVRDAAYSAFIAPARRRSATEVVVDPESLDLVETPRVSPGEELAELVALARSSGVPDADLDLLRHLVRAGSPLVVAAECNVTVRTVRNRRDRLTARLRRLALAA
jgi:hypothetical protein